MELILCTKNDIPALAAFFASAMAEDPLYRAMIPGAGERRRALPLLFEKYFTDYAEALTLLRTPDSGGAVCFCAGDAAGEERIVLPAPLQPYYARMEDIAAPDFYGDFLLLDLLAVAPAARGKGYARVLMNAFLSACAEAGKVGVAEIYNEKNLPFYEHFGFTCAHRARRNGVTAFLMEARV